MKLKSLFGIFSTLLFTVTVFAQQGEVLNPSPRPPYTPQVFSDSNSTHSQDNGQYLIKAEVMPQPRDGIQGIQRRLVYPFSAKRSGITGKVYVLAFVDEYGDVKKTEILASSNEVFNQAAADAIKATKFIPAKINGKYVKVQVAIHIVFDLN